MENNETPITEERVNVNGIKSMLVLAKYSLMAMTRNKSTVFFGFLFPFMFILIFGLIGNSATSFQIGVWSDSVNEGPVFEALDQIDSLELVTDKTDEKISEDLAKGALPLAVKFSPKEGGGVNLEITKSNASQQAEAVNQLLNSIVYPINNPPGVEGEELITVNTETVEGREFKTIDFVLPGQLSFALLSTGVFGIAFTFLTLRQTLVIKRIFATPTPKWAIIGSEVISKLIYALFQALVIVVVGVLLLDFTLANGLVTLLQILALSAFGLLSFLGFGLLASSLSNDENSMGPIINLMTLPQFLLSGTFFPIESFPEFLQPISRVLPLTYLSSAMREIAFEGASLIDVAPDLLALGLWGLVVYALVVRFFKWEVAK